MLKRKGHLGWSPIAASTGDIPLCYTLPTHQSPTIKSKGAYGSGGAGTVSPYTVSPYRYGCEACALRREAREAREAARNELGDSAIILAGVCAHGDDGGKGSGASKVDNGLGHSARALGGAHDRGSGGRRGSGGPERTAPFSGEAENKSNRDGRESGRLHIPCLTSPAENSSASERTPLVSGGAGKKSDGEGRMRMPIQPKLTPKATETSAAARGFSASDHTTPLKPPNLDRAGSGGSFATAEETLQPEAIGAEEGKKIAEGSGR